MLTAPFLRICCDGWKTQGCFYFGFPGFWLPECFLFVNFILLYHQNCEKISYQETFDTTG